MKGSRPSSLSMSPQPSTAPAATHGAHAAVAEHEESTTTTTTTTTTATTGACDQVLVVRSEAAHDRHGHPYLRLSLRTQDGRLVEARWWRYPYPLDHRPRVGQVCRVWGELDQFRGRPQLRVQTMRPAPDVLVAAFVGSAALPVEVLRTELDARIAQLDHALAAVVRTVLSGEVYERFCVWPASHARHGAVRHGLLDHSLRVAVLAKQLAGAYQGQTALGVDADLVTAACLLHDVGKVYTLPELPGAALPEAALDADHVTRSALLVQAAAAQVHAEARLAPERLEALMHAILAHHGRREWSAPVEPHTTEAWLVHLADYAESRLAAFSALTTRGGSSHASGAARIGL